MKEIELMNSDEVAIVDDDDFAKLAAYEWRIFKTPTIRVYVATGSGVDTVLLHRFLMQPKYKQQVMHLNADGLDNRRCNLRCGSRSEVSALSNTCAKRKGRLRGVQWRQGNGKFQAIFHLFGKQIYLGYFDTEQKAHEAYLQKAKDIYGTLIDNAKWAGKEAATNA